MEVLSSRLIHRCPDLGQAVAFWCDTVGLRIYREYGHDGERTGVVLFAGGGFLELTASGGVEVDGSDERPPCAVLWLQVNDVDDEATRLTVAGVDVDGPRDEPWGLREAWLEDPFGLRVVLVEVPEDPPIRRRVEL